MIIPLRLSGGSTDLSFITAGAGQILSGYVGANSSGEAVNGSITTRTNYTIAAADEFGKDSSNVFARFPANCYYNQSGSKTGYTYVYIPGDYIGTAAASSVLSGSTFSSSAGAKLTGTMANKGAWSSSGLAAGSSVTIPAGYHNGSGKVTAAAKTSYAGTITAAGASYSWTEASAGSSTWKTSSDSQLSFNPGLSGVTGYACIKSGDVNYGVYGASSYGIIQIGFNYWRWAPTSSGGQRGSCTGSSMILPFPQQSVSVLCRVAV